MHMSRLFFDNPAFRAVFLREGLEDLSDALIDELVKKGIPRADLVYLRDNGHSYCRERKSFPGPVIFE